MTAVIVTVYVVLAALAVVAARDTTRRGGTGELVGLGIFFVPPLGLALWLAARGRPAGEAPADPSGCPVHR